MGHDLKLKFFQTIPKTCAGMVFFLRFRMLNFYELTRGEISMRQNEIMLQVGAIDSL